MFRDNGTGNYTAVTSISAATELNFKSNFSGRYIVAIGSGRSRLGLYGGGDYVFKLTTTDEVPPEPTPTISTLSLNPVSVQGGITVQAIVSLVNPAPSCGTSVSLFSSNPGVVQVPASVTIAGGSTSATFTVSTIALESTTTANITAIAGGTKQEATLTVTPASIITP